MKSWKSHLESSKVKDKWWSVVKTEKSCGWMWKWQKIIIGVAKMKNIENGNAEVVKMNIDSEKLL